MAGSEERHEKEAGSRAASAIRSILATAERFAASWLPLATAVVLLLGVAYAMGTDRRPSHFFKEGRPFTLLSCAYLGVVAGVSCDLAARATRTGPNFPAERPGRERLFWTLTSAGFAFLAFDEVACLHEKAGDWLTRIVYGRWKSESPDEVSDSLVTFGYLFFALGVVAYFRRELGRYRRHLPSVATALVCGALSMTMDFSTDDPEFVKSVERRGPVWRNAILALDAAEDFFKVLAGALMVRAFVLVRRTAVHPGEAGPDASSAP